jgi:hypothetical protein
MTPDDQLSGSCGVNDARQVGDNTRTINLADHPTTTPAGGALRGAHSCAVVKAADPPGPITRP